MHRTTIMLPPELRHRAQRRAQEEGISLGELVRKSLEGALEEPKMGRDDDPLLCDDAVFRDEAPADLAAEHDRYLYDGEP